ncbi:MAG: SAM-dependent methyltransferase, partial [Clostridium sp.]
DVSFISLRTIMPATVALLKEDGEVVALIKPQFEAGRDKVGKKGVVRDINVHIEVVTKIVDYLISKELKVLGLSYSPIKGPEGNREYLVYFTKDKEKVSDFKIEQIDEIVQLSHNQL